MQSHAAAVPARILTKISVSLFDYCTSMHDHRLTNVKIPFLLSVTTYRVKCIFEQVYIPNATYP